MAKAIIQRSLPHNWNVWLAVGKYNDGVLKTASQLTSVMEGSVNHSFKGVSN